MKFGNLSHTRQMGVSLVELAIALGLVVLIITATVSTLGQESQKAQMLQAKLQLVQAGILRLQTDMPCGVAKLSALIRREDAIDGLCGESNSLDRWHGPYIEASSMFVNDGGLDLSPIIPGASMAINQEVVGTEMFTVLKVNGITNEIRSAMIVRCGDDCIPYKTLTNDETSIGLMVSKVKLQALTNQNYEVAPLSNVCQPGNGC